jgi:hypothetical protein
MFREHQQYWQSIPGQRHAKLSTKWTVKFLKLSRYQAKEVKGLLTGHCYLKGHLFKVGIIDSPIWGRCHMGTKRASHILCEGMALDE